MIVAAEAGVLAVEEMQNEAAKREVIAGSKKE